MYSSIYPYTYVPNHYSKKRHLSYCRSASYIGRNMVRSASETLGFIKPELPTLVPEPPTGEGWIHEITYDGYRTWLVIDRGQVPRLHPEG
jgi:ATP-dependent DNA ligase